MGTTVGTTLSTTLNTKLGTTLSTTQSTTRRSSTSSTLTAAQLIRLCFTTGRGCDFNQDFSIKTEATTLTATPSSSPSPPTPTPRTAANTREAQTEMLRERLKLCFFSSICEIDGSQTKVRQPRIIKPPPAARALPKSRAATKREKMKNII